RAPTNSNASPTTSSGRPCCAASGGSARPTTSSPRRITKAAGPVGEGNIMASTATAIRTSFGLPGDVVSHVWEESGLPLMVEPATAALASDPAAALDWFREHREAVEALLPEHGGVTLRGFAIPTTDDFNRLVEGYQTDPHGYAGGLTPRKNISGKVFEASRVPADQKIILHQEMAYLPKYPKMVGFYCLIPSATGGCTTIGDIRRFQ